MCTVMHVTATRLRLVSIAAFVAISAPAPGTNAAPQDPPEVGRAAIDEATTPLPIRTQIALKPSYTFPNGSKRYTAELQFEPLLPYRGFLLPDLEVSGFWSVARLQLSGKSQQDSQGPASGLTDLTLTDVAARRVGPLELGAGFATVFPMATTAALGQGKLQIGPSVAARIDAHPLKVALLVQNLYSVAGNSQSPNLAYVSVQPFITFHLPAALFLSSDATTYFYWAGGKSTVPVDLGFGHAFSEGFVGALQLWYTVAGKDQGDVEVRAVLDFQPSIAP